MISAGIPWKRLTLEIESRLEAVPLLGPGGALAVYSGRVRARLKEAR